MSRAEALEQLLDPVTLARVQQGITTAVRGSFHEDRVRTVSATVVTSTVTRNEVRRRTDMAYRWFMVMRADLGYSAAHALDLLPQALRAELDGVHWEPPPADRSWAANNQAVG